MGDQMPKTVGLCPDPACTGDFYMPDPKPGDRCPTTSHSDYGDESPELVIFVAAMRSGAPPPSDSVEALERVAREWLADLSPHGADVGEDAAMMATELIAALDAVPAPEHGENLRWRVADAIRRMPADASSEELADAAIAAMRSGAPPEDDG